MAHLYKASLLACVGALCFSLSAQAAPPAKLTHKVGVFLAATGQVEILKDDSGFGFAQLDQHPNGAAALLISVDAKATGAAGAKAEIRQAGKVLAKVDLKAEMDKHVGFDPRYAPVLLKTSDLCTNVEVIVTDVAGKRSTQQIILACGE